MPRGGKREGAGRPRATEKTAVTLRLENGNADWLKSRKGQGKMIDGMIRAKRLEELEGLAEAIARFLQLLKPQQIEEVLGVPIQVEKICALVPNEVVIEKSERGYFGLDSLKKITKKNGLSFEMTREELYLLFTEVVRGYGQNDWVRLNMAIRIRPCIIAKTAKPQMKTSETGDRFWERFAQENNELEARLEDPSYWEQIQRDLS